MDREKGIIYDVLVLGYAAKNKTVYTSEAREEALRDKTYDGLQVYIGPHKKNKRAKRSPHDHAGELMNPRDSPEGIRADLKYNRESTGGKLAVEIAERFPHAFGLSHHADVEGFVDERGNKIVSRILEAYVADIVKDPSTTSEVFEEAEVPEAEGGEESPMEIDDAIVKMQHCILQCKEVDDKVKEKAIKKLHQLKAMLKGEAEPEDEEDDEEDEKSKKSEAKEEVDISRIIEAAVKKAVAAAIPKKAPPKSTARSTVTEEVNEPSKAPAPATKVSFKRGDVASRYGEDD